MKDLQIRMDIKDFIVTTMVEQVVFHDCFDSWLVVQLLKPFFP